MTTDLIDPQLLKVAAPETPIQQLAAWADPIKLGCIEFNISGVRPIAALLAQAAHESCGFQHLSENLNYTAKRLCEVWPRRFPKLAAAQPYARNPEALANFVYANRMGNGAPESGDGWRHRGFGPFQVTGHDNQAAFGEAIGMPLAQVPDYIRTINGGAMSMCWFFQTRGLEDLAKTPGIADETQAINGGLEGLPDRKRRFDAVVAEMVRRGA